MNTHKGIAPHRLALLALIGAALAFRPWVSTGTNRSLGSGGDFEFAVTSSEDAGEGSLREVLFRANRAPGRARIVIEVDRVELRVPLPPLSNPDGIHLVAAGDSVVVTGPSAGAIPLLDVVTPSLIERIVLEAPGSICVRATAQVRMLRDVLRFCEIGVLMAGAAKGSEVADTHFDRNVTGLRLDGVEGSVRVRRNEFTQHSETAVWVGGITESSAATAPIIEDNAFQGDRISILLAGGPAVVSKNVIRGSEEAGVFLGGSGHSIVGNRVEDGARVGILVDQATRTAVEGNQVSGNVGVGILIRSGSGVTVRDNQTHRNGYGLMFLLEDRGNPSLAEGNVASGNRIDGIAVLGASPILRGNVASGNRMAGLRIDDWAGPNEQIRSNPVIEANRLSNNGADGPVRGTYPIS